MKCSTEGCKGKTTTFQEGSEEHAQWTTAQKKRDRGETVWFIVFGFIMCGFFLATKF